MEIMPRGDPQHVQMDFVVKLLDSHVSPGFIADADSLQQLEADKVSDQIIRLFSPLGLKHATENGKVLSASSVGASADPFSR